MVINSACVYAERLYPSTGNKQAARPASTGGLGGCASSNVPETHDSTLKPVEGYSPSGSRVYRTIPYNIDYIGYAGDTIKCPSCLSQIPADDAYITDEREWMCLDCGVERGLVW